MTTIDLIMNAMSSVIMTMIGMAQFLYTTMVVAARFFYRDIPYTISIPARLYAPYDVTYLSEENNVIIDLECIILSRPVKHQRSRHYHYGDDTTTTMLVVMQACQRVSSCLSP